MNNVTIGQKKVGDRHPLYFIAEGGLTNWGNLKNAKRQVDVAMSAGADAVKFQAQTTEDLISKKVAPEWYKRLKYKELSHEDLKELNQYCSIRNIDFSVTPHTYRDLEFVISELDVAFLKIGSGESINQEFLGSASNSGKPMVVSVGLHLDEKEVYETVSTIEKSGCRDIIILFCNTVYPTPPEAVNLPFLKRLVDSLPYPIGYSDHTVGTHIALAAVALGASVIEKHISFNKKDMRSFDCPVSCEPGELFDFIQQIRDLEKALQDNRQERKNRIVEARKWAGQSIMAAEDLPAGAVIRKDNIVMKRPGTGISCRDIDKVLERKLKDAVEKDELIRFDNLS